MKKYVKLIAVASLVVFMLCLCGCGEVKEAQNKLEDMLATLKKGDYVSALEDYVCEKEENRDFLATFSLMISNVFTAVSIIRHLLS